MEEGGGSFLFLYQYTEKGLRKHFNSAGTDKNEHLCPRIQVAGW